ncbi:MAG: hypothetical protein JXR77_13870 [Lentisphaeria bacterium]|nr:hypothetical protein [Lentisphaeria bacterium]
MDKLRVENPRLPLLQLRDLRQEGGILRAGRPERLTMIVRNAGVATAKATARLEFPDGSRCLGDVTYELGALSPGGGDACGNCGSTWPPGTASRAPAGSMPSASSDRQNTDVPERTVGRAQPTVDPDGRHGGGASAHGMTQHKRAFCLRTAGNSVCLD